MATRAVRFIHKFENNFASAILILLALLPVGEIIARTFFKTGIPASATYTAHLVLWITFVGGLITSREGAHLSLTVGVEALRGVAQKMLRTLNNTISSAMCVAFFWSAVSFILIGFNHDNMIGFLPIVSLTIIMPIGYLGMAIRFISDPKLTRRGAVIAASGLLIGTVLAIPPIINMAYMYLPEVPVWVDSVNEVYFLWAERLGGPLFFFLAAAAFFGTPLFIALGGIGYVLFAGSWGAMEVIPNEAYTMLTGSSIAAIPLFTLTGFVLSESKAGERLVRFFQALFGWIPGGTAVVAVLVCTFFTTFTGASGVTILALGGLLSYVMINTGKYSERFTHGLLTASGSVGLLLPPSLPIILYGVVAGISIRDMFIGGIIPGIILVLILSSMGVIVVLKHKDGTVSTSLRAIRDAFSESIWEILMPVVILAAYFSGLTTLTETGGVAVVYALIIEVFVKRDIRLKEIPTVMLKSIPIVGGVLVILAVARGLSYYVIDAEIPMRLTAWVEQFIHSKYVFLILLNFALLVTGCLMDIFSAIMVVVPLMIPLGQHFGIDPIHLGIIFLTNLSLGYLTPPVGMNLFLASYRFNKPLNYLYRAVLPFFAVQLVAVLLITYVPWLSTGLVTLLK